MELLSKHYNKEIENSSRYNQFKKIQNVASLLETCEQTGQYRDYQTVNYKSDSYIITPDRIIMTMVTIIALIGAIIIIIHHQTTTIIIIRVRTTIIIRAQIIIIIEVIIITIEVRCV